MPSKRFDELAVGDVVVEEIWDGDDGATMIVRREYLGAGRFRLLTASGQSPIGHVEVDGADPWDDYELDT
jgi:translation initiation factor IF-1